MNTKEIADRLVELCRTGDFDSAQKELYSDDITSTEPYESEGFAKEAKGIEAIREKGEKWKEMVQNINSITVSEPLIVNNSFACNMQMDVTMKDGSKMDMGELCVYTVKDGKVNSETFYV